MIRVLVVSATVFGAACANLSAPEPAGKCGNGVIEEGEDCDNTTARCVACALMCPDELCKDQNDAIIPGYTCGIDHVCHAPSGVFSQTDSANAVLPIFGGAFLDVDRDGIQDLVGLSETALQVRYGDPQGKLTRGTELETPFVTGTSAYGAIDGGSVVEAVVPTPDGLAAYTSASGAMLPFPFSQPAATYGCTLVQGKIGLGGFSVDPFRVAAFVANNGAIELYILDASNPTNCVQAAPLCVA
jgi:hypothetical protein